MPPIGVHVADDEVPLDHSRHYEERAVAAVADATLDVGMGMAHGFTSAVGRMDAAKPALDAVRAFLRERLARQATARAAR